jgi:hypothetical protein
MPLPHKSSQGFKGFPLLDFVDPNGFSLDHILRSTSLRTEIERHIKSFAIGKSKSKCGCEKHEASRVPRGFDPSIANPYVNAVATADDTSQSLQQQLEKFLDGLYLGCFESSVVQPDAQRPPQSYICDIGFNTDKPTGFIVANPFDTLVTFGPRGRHSPYGALDLGGLRMPRVPNIKVKRVVPERKGTGKTSGTLNPDFVTTFGTAVGDDRGDDGPRASIICDLNIRIVRNQRQELQQLSFYGDTMKVHLSKGLVQPVERSVANEWVKTGKRLALAMGNRMITLRRNRLPTWGGPVDLGGATVSITASNVVGRLHRIDLGGTVEKPLIVFDGVEILA